MENENRGEDKQSPKAETEQSEFTATGKKAERRADVPPAGDANYKSDDEQKYRRAIVFLTAGLLVATTAYSIAAYYQLRILNSQAQLMNDTLTETKKAAEASKVAAEAARGSADAAKESNRITLQTTREDRRAWVGTRSFIGEEIRLGVEIRFGVRITNLGKTPAKNVRTQTSWRALPRSIPFSPIYNKSTTNVQQPSASVLMPTFEGALLAPPITFTEAQVEALRARLSYFYIYGRITYEDIFGRPHKTMWCLYIGEDFKRMTACETYNDAD